MKHERWPTRLWRQFLVEVDGEGVPLFTWTFYAVFMTSGIYNLSAGNPPLTLVGSMSGVSFPMWCWLNIIGPICCFGGTFTRWAHTREIRRSGGWLRLSGDATLAVATIAYTVATFQVEHWGRGSYGGFLGAATTLSLIFLCLRDARRIRYEPI